MKKSDLQSGYVIKERSGNYGMIIDDWIWFERGYDNLDDYDDYLKCPDCSQADIVKVFDTDFSYGFSILQNIKNVEKEYHCIWDEDDVNYVDYKDLNEEELEFMKSILISLEVEKELKKVLNVLDNEYFKYHDSSFYNQMRCIKDIKVSVQGILDVNYFDFELIEHSSIKLSHEKYIALYKKIYPFFEDKLDEQLIELGASENSYIITNLKCNKYRYKPVYEDGGLIDLVYKEFLYKL